MFYWIRLQKKNYCRLPPKFIPRWWPYLLPALPRRLRRRRFLPPPLPPSAIKAIQSMKPRILKNQMRMQHAQPPQVLFLQHSEGAHFPSSDSSSESSSDPSEDDPDEKSSSLSSVFCGCVVTAGATWLLGKIVLGGLDLGSTWISSMLIASDTGRSIWIVAGPVADVLSRECYKFANITT